MHIEISYDNFCKKLFSRTCIKVTRDFYIWKCLWIDLSSSAIIMKNIENWRCDYYNSFVELLTSDLKNNDFDTKIVSLLKCKSQYLFLWVKD